MMQQKWHGREFPHIIEYNGDLAAYIQGHHNDIDTELAASGAVLFRGFDVGNSTKFDEAIIAYGAENFAYKESLSNAVRVNVTPRVFTANEAPPDTSIYLHHEMAQTPIYPSKLFFYCEVAANKGGATPICRSDILLEKLIVEAPDFVENCIEKGVCYTSIMPAQDDAKSGQGRSWRSTLSVDNTQAAEQRLDRLDYEWEWQADESLRVTTPKLDAVKKLDDGRNVFFNQLIAAFRGWSDIRNTASKSISFGDGMPITTDDMAAAIRIADEISYDLKWRAGDVVLIDNFIVMHGRRPFEGKRRVLASLIQ